MHTIRLRGPWEYRRVDDTNLPFERLKLPADWSSVCRDTTSSSSFEFRRSFHRPTGIEENDNVSIVLSQLPSATAILNGQPLGTTSDDGSARLPIASLLADRNELQVLVDLRHNQSCMGEVVIQIDAQTS